MFTKKWEWIMGYSFNHCPRAFFGGILPEFWLVKSKNSFLSFLIPLFYGVSQVGGEKLITQIRK